jgi:hypothetical protein
MDPQWTTYDLNKKHGRMRHILNRPPSFALIRVIRGQTFFDIAVKIPPATPPADTNHKDGLRP